MSQEGGALALRKHFSSLISQVLNQSSPLLGILYPTLPGGRACSLPTGYLPYHRAAVCWQNCFHVFVGYCLLLRLDRRPGDGWLRLGVGHARLASLVAAGLGRQLGRLRCVHLAVSQEQETGNDEDPVQIVRKDTSQRRTVLPAQQGVEEAPATTTVELGTAALQIVSVLCGNIEA